MAEPYSWRVDINLYDNYTGGSNRHFYQSGIKVNSSSSYVVGVTIPSYTPRRTGYNFLGYTKNSDGSGTVYQVGDVYSVGFHGSQTKSLDLYAKWQIQTYTVSYNANGGTGAPSSQTKTYGTNLTLRSTAPTRANYIFQGWATSSTGSVAYQPGGTYSTNSSVTLYAIWRIAGSTLSSVSNTAVGSSGTASWNIINTGYTYKLVLSYSNAPSVTVNVAANVSSTSFTIPSTWYSYITNATSVTATATLTTYNGSSALGTSTKTFTVSIPSSIKPSISSFTASHYSDNATVSGWGVYTQGYSQVDLSASATPGEGASIVSYSFSGTGISQSSASTSGRTSVLGTSGSKTYTLTVTDSRGRTATSTVSITVYDYSTPSVSSLDSFRCLSDGTQSDTDGTYIHSTPVFAFSSVNGNNSLTVKKIEYKEHSSSSWTSGVASATSGTGYTFGGGNISVTTVYDVQCTVTDSLGNTATLSVLVPTVVGFALGLKNDRARFGGPVQKAGLQVDWDTEFNGTVDITPRRCYATLSSAGWYRVLKFSAQSAYDANGYAGSQIEFNIGRYGTENETHSIRLHILNVTPAIVFTDESSKSYTLKIDKIRYTRNGSFGYVDIHINASVGYFYAVFSVYDRPERQALYTAESLQSVADSPAGETVLTTYSFDANVNGGCVVVTRNVTSSAGGYFQYTDYTRDKYAIISSTTTASDVLIIPSGSTLPSGQWCRAINSSLAAYGSQTFSVTTVFKKL